MRVVSTLLVVACLLLGEMTLSAPTDLDELEAVDPDHPSVRMHKREAGFNQDNMLHTFPGEIKSLPLQPQLLVPPPPGLLPSLGVHPQPPAPPGVLPSLGKRFTEQKG